MASFASDNTSFVAPEIMHALMECNHGHAGAYGNDDCSRLLTEKFRSVFDHPELLVFPVFNGSAANSAALATLIHPHQAVICHRLSHIHNDECGMPELFTGGKLLTIDGPQAKITPDTVTSIVHRARDMGVDLLPKFEPL